MKIANSMVTFAYNPPLRADTREPPQDIRFTADSGIDAGTGGCHEYLVYGPHCPLGHGGTR